MKENWYRSQLVSREIEKFVDYRKCRYRYFVIDTANTIFANAMSECKARYDVGQGLKRINLDA